VNHPPDGADWTAPKSLEVRREVGAPRFAFHPAIFRAHASLLIDYAESTTKSMMVPDLNGGNTMTRAYLEPADSANEELTGFRSEMWKSIGGQQEIPLRLTGDSVRIGTAPDCDAAINDRTVSRHHAILRRVGTSWIIEDDGSSNGTCVNGRRITCPTNIKEGDHLTFGAARFFLREGRPASGNNQSISANSAASKGAIIQRTILEQIMALTPHEFEKLIQKLFASLSFESVITSQTNDGGVDVRAVNSGLIFRGRYSIQCKRYTKKNVSRPEINAFFGVVTHERTRGIFVTSTSFSKGAREFAEHNGINLIEGKELEVLIKRHRVL
jgi:hypothetical protein